jgi:hypothetical protein
MCWINQSAPLASLAIFSLDSGDMDQSEDNINFYLPHWYKSDRVVPGRGTDVSDQANPGPEYDFLLWAVA